MSDWKAPDRRIADGGLGRPHVSVVIPVYNGGEPFRRCLAALVQAQPRPSAVIVVADGDTDDSRKLAAEFGARVIIRDAPGGPARARNLGARAIRTGDILLFIDADVAIHPDAIGEVASSFANDPTVAAVIGSYDDHPSAVNFLSQFKNLFHHYTHQTAREEASTFWGACGAIRFEIFHKFSGFDERYRYPSIEDIELGYRLQRGGYRIRLLKTLQATHLKEWRIGSLLKADVFHRALPWTELIYRDRKLINDLNLGYSSRLSAVLLAGVFAAVLASAWMPQLLGIAGISSMMLLGLNAGVYRFFYRTRGLWFTLRVIPWHWSYFLYSGIAFAIGTARHFATRSWSRLEAVVHRTGSDATGPAHPRRFPFMNNRRWGNLSEP
jgi:GT2 family glycosyltransferase